MFSTDLLASNLLSPVVLAFALGLFARAVRSDLEVPAAIQTYLSIFLLLAIGLKGGVALSENAPTNLPVLVLATLPVALVVTLEIPAILIGLALAKGSDGLRWRQVREVLTGKTAVLLIGGLAIGVIAGRDGVARVDAMYVQLFQGTLMLFMLDMGMVAAAQLRSVGREAFRLATFATLVPLLHGLLGVALGHWIGMNAATKT